MIAAMVREITKRDTVQTVEIGEYCSVVENNRERIIGTDQGTIRTIEMILEEEICNQTRIIEVKIIETDTEEITEMIILEEVEVGLGMDKI